MVGDVLDRGEGRGGPRNSPPPPPGTPESFGAGPGDPRERRRARAPPTVWWDRPRAFPPHLERAEALGGARVGRRWTGRTGPARVATFGPRERAPPSATQYENGWSRRLRDHPVADRHRGWGGRPLSALGPRASLARGRLWPTCQTSDALPRGAPPYFRSLFLVSGAGRQLTEQGFIGRGKRRGARGEGPRRGPGRRAGRLSPARPTHGRSSPGRSRRACWDLSRRHAARGGRGGGLGGRARAG